MLLFGCKKDYVGVSPGIDDPIDKTEQFVLDIIENSVVETRAMTAASVGELKILNGKLLVFGTGGVTLTKEFDINFEPLVSLNGTTAPIINIIGANHTDTGIKKDEKVMLFLNVDFSGVTLSVNTTTLASLSSALLQGNGLIDGAVVVGEGPNVKHYLPMSSAMTTWPLPLNESIPVTRAVSKFQVKLGANIAGGDGNGSKHFTPEKVTYKLFQYAVNGNLKYPISVTPKVPTKLKQTAAITEIAGGVVYNAVQAAGVESNSAGASYVYSFPYSDYMLGTTVDAIEAPSNVANGAYGNDTKRLAIILKVAQEPVTEFRYYRLDFYDKRSKTFLDVGHNQHIKLNINSVNHMGYKSATDALMNPPSNIDYDISIEGDNVVISDGMVALSIEEDVRHTSVIGLHATEVQQISIKGKIEAVPGVGEMTTTWGVEYIGDAASKVSVVLPQNSPMSTTIKSHAFSISQIRGAVAWDASIDGIRLTVSYGENGLVYTSPEYDFKEITNVVEFIEDTEAGYDYNFVMGSEVASIPFQVKIWDGFGTTPVIETALTYEGTSAAVDFTSSIVNNGLVAGSVDLYDYKLVFNATATASEGDEMGVEVVGKVSNAEQGRTKRYTLRKVSDRVVTALELQSRTEPLVLSTGVESWTSSTGEGYIINDVDKTISLTAPKGDLIVTGWKKFDLVQDKYITAGITGSDPYAIPTGFVKTDVGSRGKETVHTTFIGKKTGGVVDISGKLWSKIPAWALTFTGTETDVIYMGRIGSPVGGTAGLGDLANNRKRGVIEASASPTSDPRMRWSSNINKRYWTGDWGVGNNDGKSITEFIRTDHGGDMSSDDGGVNAINHCYRKSAGAATGTDAAVEWHLPAINQLRLMYALRNSGDNFNTNDWYWSATEYDASGAWLVGFSYGYVNISGKSGSDRVRCVRDL